MPWPWSSSKFDADDEERQEENAGRSKANISTHHPSTKRSNREAAFVSALEETALEKVDDFVHSTNSRQAEKDSAPFEAFLAAALSTLLALLLAWRFLAWEQRKVDSCRSDEEEDIDVGIQTTCSQNLHPHSIAITTSSLSPDSSDSSSAGHWRYYKHPLTSNTHSESSSTDTCKTQSSPPNRVKQRKKRRQFDERLAPKRRHLEQEHQLSPPTKPGSVEDACLTPSTAEVLKSGCNLVAEWPTTLVEDTSITMATNFRPYPHSECSSSSPENGKDEYGGDHTTITSVSNHTTAMTSIPQTGTSEKTLPNRTHGSSSTRRPLVSPPPPPTDHSSTLISNPYADKMSHIDTGRDQEDDDDFLGSDLPHGFVNSMTDEITKSTNQLLDELAEAESLLSSMHPQEIVRDLDTITEVSETDDLTSISSNGYSDSRRNQGSRKGWSRSSTVPCDDRNASECYRLAPTVTACSSSTETVNGCEAYVDDECAVETSSQSCSFHDAQQTAGFTAWEKIDHVSRSSVIIKHERQEGRLAEDITTTTTSENAFVTAWVAAGPSVEAGRDLFAPAQRHEYGEAEFVHSHATDGRLETGSLVYDELNYAKPDEFENTANVNFRKFTHADDLDNSLTPTSSGRTSVATDLPNDETPESEPPLANAISSEAKPNFEYSDECHAKNSSTIVVHEASGKEETGSLNILNDRTTITIVEQAGENLRQEGEDDSSSSSAKKADQSSSHSLSWPRRERRFQLAYQQYHSIDGDQEKFPSTESEEFSTSSSSISEPTKTTFLKPEITSVSLIENRRRDRPDSLVVDEEASASSCMDQIDLQKALQRFARYGELYGDAPRSGMDEFRSKTDPVDGSDIHSLFNPASRMNSLPNSGGVMEALLKSTLHSKGSPSVNGANIVSSSMKREGADRVGDELLLANNSTANGGAIHALATAYSNGDHTKIMTDHGISQNPRHQKSERQGRTSVVEESNKRTPKLLYDDSQPPSTQRRPSRLGNEEKVLVNDKNRYSPRSPPTAGAFENSNRQDGICIGKFKTADTVVLDRRNRPTSAPLTPLLMNSPASSGLGFGFSDAYDQGAEPLCVASATSQAIINDPNSSKSAYDSNHQNRRKILAEASANAVASNPYIALARATTAAASKVAEASNENLLDDGLAGTVSLVVSSTVTTTKRDFFSTTKSTPDLLFFSSQDAYNRNQNEAMSFRKTIRSPAREITPTYGVIPRGTASIFQQRHREMSPGRNTSSIRSPDRKRHNFGHDYTNGIDTSMRSSATTPIRTTQESKKILFASSDHLQKLLEDPYYVKTPEKPQPPKRSPPKQEQPSPNRSPPKPTQLSQRIMTDWDRRPENSLDNQKQQNLLRWRNSMNLAENEELRAAMLEDQNRAKAASPSAKHDDSMESESKRSCSLRATTPLAELWDYKIFRDEQKRAEVELDEDAKRARRNKYRSKIDRAKRDYLTSKASASDLYRSIEDFEKKFNVSMENVRLPDPPRGPYLEYLSRSGNLHVIDVNDIPPPAYVRPKPRFDREYESIVKKAEESWAAYKRRLHAAASKYGSRAYSTGMLETDVDDPQDYRGQKSIVETDLDQVQRDIEHESRKRTKGYPQTSDTNGHYPRNAHSRAKSADYLMDQRARTEIEPPENQLQKILGEKDEKDMSEHELRFRKSTEKLQIPDWYLNSDYCPGGKIPSPDPLKSRQSGYQSDDRPKSTQGYHHQYGKSSTGKTSPVPSGKSTARATTPAGRRDESPSRYVSPWIYGGRISGPQGMKSPERERKRAESPPSFRSIPIRIKESPRSPSKSTEPTKPIHTPRSEMNKSDQHSRMETTSIMRTNTSTSKSITQSTLVTTGKQKQDFILPKHFFDKYKDEIEEMRKSRGALNIPILDMDDDATWEQKRLSAQGLPVPVATVRPNQLHDDEYDTTTSISFSPASSPESRPMSRPGQYGQPTPQSRQQFPTAKPSPAPRTTLSTGSYRDTPLNTSTPYSSDLLPRKSPRETAFEVYPQQSKPRETAFEPYVHRPDPDKPPSYPAPQPPGLVRRPSLQASEPRHMPGGWTVSAVPPDWNVPGQRDSVVIEVAGDGLFDSATPGSKNRRLPSHMTLDEVLDSMLALGGRNNLTTIDESSSSLLDDTEVLPPRPRTPTNLAGFGIYTRDEALMDKCSEEPELAAELLKRETLWVKCGYCSRTRELDEARRKGYVSCHHCYTYYCNRVCRRADWDRHLDICSYARINTICKQVILKVRHDPESQFQMSRVAQRGYQSRGRGSVNFRFLTLTMAKNYVKDQNGGWKSLRSPPNDPAEFLRYYTVSDLVDSRKDPSLINLCRRYDPRSKFVLSVSIIVDIEECPETPPPESESSTVQPNQDSSWYQRGVGTVPYTSPHARPPPLTDTELSWMTDTRKHTNGISKDDYDYQPPHHGQYNFNRADQYRHTVAAPQRTSRQPHQEENGRNWQNPGRPALLIGPEDADETEV